MGVSADSQANARDAMSADIDRPPAVALCQCMGCEFIRCEFRRLEDSVAQARADLERMRGNLEWENSAIVGPRARPMCQRCENTPAVASEGGVLCCSCGELRRAEAPKCRICTTEIHPTMAVCDRCEAKLIPPTATPPRALPYSPASLLSVLELDGDLVCPVRGRRR
jgi:hypothetical protein